MAKQTRKRLDAGEITSRIGNCRGTVTLAIETILSGDPVQIDAAVGQPVLGCEGTGALAIWGV